MTDHMTEQEKHELREYGQRLIADREKIIREQEALLANAKRFKNDHDIHMAEEEIAFRQEEIAQVRAKLAELE